VGAQASSHCTVRGAIAIRVCLSHLNFPLPELDLSSCNNVLAISDRKKFNALHICKTSMPEFTRPAWTVAIIAESSAIVAIWLTTKM
jgi:hypothetical protein